MTLAIIVVFVIVNLISSAYEDEPLLRIFAAYPPLLLVCLGLRGARRSIRILAGLCLSGFGLFLLFFGLHPDTLAVTIRLSFVAMGIAYTVYSMMRCRYSTDTDE